jgi:hypothetical protein
MKQDIRSMYQHENRNQNMILLLDKYAIQAKESSQRLGNELLNAFELEE